MLKTVPFTKTPFAIRKKEKKEPELNSFKCSFLIDGTNNVREFSIDRSLNPEQVIQFLRCRWSNIPNSGQLGLFVSGSVSNKDRWLPNEPIEKCLDQSERFLMIRNKTKLMKIGLPDGSLRTHLLDMTIPLSKVVDTIAEKIQLPIEFWNEYSLCVEFDKESRQLELALKFLQNAKSLSGLKTLIKSANSDNYSKKIRSPLWLDATRTLAELEPIINGRLIYFRRRFWFSSISLAHENRSLVFIQFQEVKEHLKIIGSLVRSCSIGLADAAKLVAVLAKIQNPENSDQGLSKVAGSLFPAHDTKAILQVIAAKRGAGEIRLPSDEFSLQCNFIKLARDLPGYGDTFFYARNSSGVDVLLAISKMSVTFYIDGKLEERYPIDRIRRWMALPEKRLFTMEVDHGLNKMVVLDWYTDDSAEVQQLLDGYVQLTLRYKRLNIIPNDWSGEERYI